MGNSMFRTDNKFVLSLIKPLTRYFWNKTESIPVESLEINTTTLGTVVNGSTAITLADADKVPVSDANGDPAGILGHIRWDDMLRAIDTWYKSVATTFTYKRITKRVDSQISTATITPEISTYDIYVRTAQAANLTIANHSTSTPAVGDMQQFIITDDGIAAAKTLTFGNLYVFVSGLTQPTVLVTAKCTKMLFEWRLIAGVGKWDMVGSNQE